LLNRKFVEIETRGATESFIAAIENMGCEWAQFGKSRLKMVLPEDLEISQLYKAAAESEMQLRRLTYKKDSLQDIFLKAME
jgi:hypothetical protein